MNQTALVFRWYVVMQLFGLVALPITRRLFRHLPDRGYGLSKPLGLLLTGWVLWITTTLGWNSNTGGGVWSALFIVGVGGLWAACYPMNRPSGTAANTTPKASKSGTTTAILLTEVVFLIALVAWVVARAHMPRIQTAGGEKWMEIAFLRAILRSGTFPPHDPWLSGFAISYYYFGYIIIAMLTRLTAISPSIAFNLGIATLFALVCTGAFSLVYNLASIAQHEERGWWPSVGGVLGALLVAVMGNLEGALEALYARGVGPAAFWAWLDIRNLQEPPPSLPAGHWVPDRFFWWWQASRVIRDYTPWGTPQEVIDEFPAFSFILGDMHPHVLALPFVMLAIGLALEIYQRLRTGADLHRWSVYRWEIRSPLSAWEWGLYAICLGGLGFLNTWDFPIYVFLVAATYALASVRSLSLSERFSRFLTLLVPTMLMGIILYLPFWVGFQSQAGGILFNVFNATRLPHFLVMFAPLLFPIVVFVVRQARVHAVSVARLFSWTLLSIAAIWLVVGGVMGIAVGIALISGRAQTAPLAYLVAWVRGEPIPGLEGVADAHTLIPHAVLQRLLNPWTAMLLFALLVVIGMILLPARNERSDGRRKTRAEAFPSDVTPFVLLLIATGGLLAVSVEYVFLHDVFLSRMNTVFKFYFQTWVMWAIAAAFVWSKFLRQGRVGVMLVGLTLVIAGLVYPALAIPARAREYGGPVTLDGAAHLAQSHPDDYAAIVWLNEHVPDAPVILEAPAAQGGAYVYESRVSAHTGLPTLLGWAGHERQWRGNYDEQARREPDIERIFTTTNPEEVLPLLEKYDIRYVYVGPVERARYPASGLSKFDALMEVVYRQGEVTIYYRP